MTGIFTVLNVIIAISLVVGLIYWFRHSFRESESTPANNRPIISGWGIFLIVFFVIPIFNNTQEVTPTRIPLKISFDTVEERFEFLEAIGVTLPINDIWRHTFNTTTFVRHYMGGSVLDIMGHIEMLSDDTGRPAVHVHPFTQHSGLIMGVNWREHHTFANLDGHMLTVHTTGVETFAILPFIFWESRLSIGGNGVASSNNTALLVQLLNIGMLIFIPVYFIFRKRI